MTPQDIFQILTTNEFGACVIDSQQTILFWNTGAQRILGHSPEQTLERPCHRIADGSPDGGLTIDCLDGCPALRAVRAGLTPAKFKTSMLSSSGSRIPVSVTALAVPDLLESGMMLIYVFTDGQDDSQDDSQEQEQELSLPHALRSAISRT